MGRHKRKQQRKIIKEKMVIGTQTIMNNIFNSKSIEVEQGEAEVHIEVV